MKKHLIIGLLAIAALFTPSTQAQNLLSQATAFTVTGTASATNGGLTTASTVIPVGNGRAQVQFAQFSTDRTNGGLLFYNPYPTNTVVFTSTNVASTIVQAVGTNFAANDIAVMRFAPNTVNESYQRLVVSAVTATNITFTAATAVASSVGDIIYRMNTNAIVAAVGAASAGQTNSLVQSAATVYNGLWLKPVLVDLVANTNAQIYNVSGTYRNP